MSGDPKDATADSPSASIDDAADPVSVAAMGEAVGVGPLSYVVHNAYWLPSVRTQFSVERPQQEFLIVKVTATNNGNEACSVSDFELIDTTTERVYEPESMIQIALGEKGFSTERINPGMSESGNLVFDVPRLEMYVLAVPGPGLWSTKAAYVTLDTTGR